MHVNSRLQDERNYCYNCSILHKLWTILSLVSFFLNYEGDFQVSSFKVFEERTVKYSWEHHRSWVLNSILQREVSYFVENHHIPSDCSVVAFPALWFWGFYLSWMELLGLKNRVSSALVRWLSTKQCFLAHRICIFDPLLNFILILRISKEFLKLPTSLCL